MARELKVFVFKINETSKSSNSDKGLVASLENGMSTDITISRNGTITTKTNDEDLIKYLQDPLWSGLRDSAVLSGGDLIVRQYKKEDLNEVVQLLVGIEDNAFEKRKMEKIAERTIQMHMNAVREHKIQYFIVEYKESVLGQVLCVQQDDIMRINPVFKNSNKEEIEAAAKAMKLIMRRLYGIFEFDNFIFDLDEDQLSLLKPLGITSNKYPYKLSIDQIEKEMEFYLQ